MTDFNWWEEQPRLWEKLVPKSGQASTVQGELIRCTLLKGSSVAAFERSVTVCRRGGSLLSQDDHSK